MPEPTWINFNTNQLPTAGLASLPLGKYTVQENWIDYSYKDAHGQKFINRYHRPAPKQQQTKKQSKAARKRARKQQKKMEQGAYAESLAGSKSPGNRRDRKSEYRKRNMNIAGDQMFEDYVLDNPQLQARAALKFENDPEPLRADIKQEYKPCLASLEVQAEPLYGQRFQSLPSFGDIQFQAPKLPQSILGNEFIGSGRGLPSSMWNPLPQVANLMAPPPKTDSLSVLRSLPAFNQFIPPSIPGQADSPGYIPPSVSFFGRLIPSKLPIFEPSNFTFPSSSLNSPTETCSSSIYNGSSWSSPINGLASPRPLWNYDGSGTPAPIKKLRNTMQGRPITLVKEGFESPSPENVSKNDNKWLKRLSNDKNPAQIPKDTDPTLPPLIEHNQKNSTSMVHLSTNSMFYKLPTPGFSSPTKNTAVKQGEIFVSSNVAKENVSFVNQKDLLSASIWAKAKTPGWDAVKHGFGIPLTDSTAETSLISDFCRPASSKDDLEDGEIFENIA